jgi:phage-related baseplate assembly protein
MAETLPIIFNEDVEPVLERMAANFESKTGRSLAPGDVERLLMNSFAYECQRLRIEGNEALRQNIVRFSRGFMLDLLAEGVGVSRLAAAGATCTIEFTLVTGHTGVTIPSDIRVQSIDGKVIFKTVEQKIVAIGTNTVEIDAICTTDGAAGNDYIAGKIAIILDPQPFVSTAVNVDTSGGGVDAETDEELRERIYLAPSQFSVAGPTDAYKFFAKSAHPSIVDVAVDSPTPGTVKIYPLCNGGTLPTTAIKNAVTAICSDEKVRPLTDTVIVADPTLIDYDIEVEIELYDTAIQSEVEDAVNAALLEYKEANENKMGRDVIISQLSALATIKDKVYNTVVVEPVADVVVDVDEYAKCGSITVTVTGSNAG